MTTGLLRPSNLPPLPPGLERGTLVASVLECRTFVEVTIPRTNVCARLRLLTRTEAKEVRQASRHALHEMGLADAARSATPEMYREWHEELVPRSLAIAVRATHADIPLAPLEEWSECHDDQIETLWLRYCDLQAQYDPLSAPLSEADRLAIRGAAKKKEMDLLVSYGCSKLASFAITSVAEPET